MIVVIIKQLAVTVSELGFNWVQKTSFHLTSFFIVDAGSLGSNVTPRSKMQVLIGSVGSKSNKVVYVKEMLEFLSQHSNLSKSVIWSPATTRVAALYSAADVYVINSQVLWVFLIVDAIFFLNLNDILLIRNIPVPSNLSLDFIPNA